MQRGISQWLNLGVRRDKLVLGLPWYGYVYPCVEDANGQPAAEDVDVCLLPPVPFAGAACSDAAGQQYSYADIMRSECYAVHSLIGISVAACRDTDGVKIIVLAWSTECT